MTFVSNDQFPENQNGIYCIYSILITLTGFLVMSIAGYSPLLLTPIISSAAVSINNGVNFHTNTNDTKSTKIALNTIQDLLYLVQDLALTFYSYLILTKILSHFRRRLFTIVYLLLVIVISALRISIMGLQNRNIFLYSDEDIDPTVKARLHLHTSYFTLLAVTEIWSAYFLLSVFAEARKNTKVTGRKAHIFRDLTRSTELRVASLAIIGIMRAVFYPLWYNDATAQIAEGDRVAYIVEAFFPIVMYIDVLSARIAAIKGGSQYRGFRAPISDSNRTPSYGGRPQVAPEQDSILLIDRPGTKSNNSYGEKSDSGVKTA